MSSSVERVPFRAGSWAAPDARGRLTIAHELARAAEAELAKLEAEGPAAVVLTAAQDRAGELLELLDAIAPDGPKGPRRW